MKEIELSDPFHMTDEQIVNYVDGMNSVEVFNWAERVGLSKRLNNKVSRARLIETFKETARFVRISENK